MALIATQRKQLAAIRKLIKSSRWADVKQGLALIESIRDPDLLALLSEGVSVSADGVLSLGEGELKSRVKVSRQENATLHMAKQAGLQSERTLLNLKVNRTLSDLQPLQGLSNLTHLDLSYCRVLRDLSGLEGLSNLTTLHLRDCPRLSSLSGLTGLSQLRTLHVFFGCEALSDPEVQSLQAALPHCTIER